MSNRSAVPQLQPFWLELPSQKGCAGLTPSIFSLPDPLLKGLGIASDAIQYVLARVETNPSLNTCQIMVTSEFLKRGITLARSTLHLACIGNLRDALALHRALFERSLYLQYLITNEQFPQFVLWSTAKQYREADVIFGDQSARESFTPEQLESLKRRQRERRGRFQCRAPKPLSKYWEKPRYSELVTCLKNNSLIPALFSEYWHQTGSAAIHPTHDDSFQNDQDFLVLANQVVIDLNLLTSTTTQLLTDNDKGKVLIWLLESVELLPQPTNR